MMVENPGPMCAFSGGDRWLATCRGGDSCDGGGRSCCEWPSRRGFVAKLRFQSSKGSGYGFLLSSGHGFESAGGAVTVFEVENFAEYDMIWVAEWQLLLCVGHMMFLHDLKS
ncbi:hypothetical protein OROMI_016734 [Orobanche minor]